MKRYLSRTLWLLAWSFWAWLGWGLYRELPRELGPTVCRLPLVEGAYPLGFLGETDTLAIWSPSVGGSRGVVLLVDATTGHVVGERCLPNPRNHVVPNTSGFGDHFSRGTLRHGVLLGADPGGPGYHNQCGGTEPFQVLDIVSGQWRRLSQRPVLEYAVHPEKPWAAIVEGTRSLPERVAVFDLATGNELLAARVRKGWDFRAGPFLLPGDRLVLHYLLPSGRTVRDQKSVLEIRTISDPSAPAEVVDLGGASLAPLVVSASGKVLFGGAFVMEQATERWVDGYDVEERRFFQSTAQLQPANDDRFDWRKMLGSATFARDGRAILRFGSEGGTLCEIGSGRVLWKAGPYERVMHADAGHGFLVAEEWHDHWARWAPSLAIETFAWRSLDDASLLSRTTRWGGVDPRDLMTSNHGKTLVAVGDGTIRPLPLRINYPLLALCQAILALPLVLLWVILRWRRIRVTANRSVVV